MATTPIEILCTPGSTATMVSRGGSGTPAGSYATTQVGGDLHTISVPEALTGDWLVLGSDGTETIVNGLEDTTTRVRLGSVETAEIVSAVEGREMTIDMDQSTPGGSDVGTQLDAAGSGSGSGTTEYEAY